MSDNKLKNEVLETKDILMKMDNLSKTEIAMSCENEETDDDVLEYNNGRPLLVPFCCATTLPRGFDLQVSGGEKSLIYDLSCLHCALQKRLIRVRTECCGQSIVKRVPGYVVKIFGCIRFIASAFPVQNDKRYDKLCGGKWTGSGMYGYDTFDDSGQGHVCCQGCVCVDKCIGCMIPHSEACTCDCPEISCNTVTVKDFEVKEEKLCPKCKYPGNLRDQRIIKFSGCFVLPSSCDNGYAEDDEKPCDEGAIKPCNEE